MNLNLGNGMTDLYETFLRVVFIRTYKFHITTLGQSQHYVILKWQYFQNFGEIITIYSRYHFF